MKEKEMPDFTSLMALRGLTLHQPWSSFVGHDLKQIETRSWPTNYRGPIAIHAAASIPAYAHEFCRDPEIGKLLQIVTNYNEERFPAEDLLPKGKIVAVAELYDCQPMTEPIQGLFGGPVFREWVTSLSDKERALGHYDKGRYGWFLRNVVLLPEPVPCSGFQRLWRVSPSALIGVREQMKKASVTGSYAGQAAASARAVAGILTSGGGER